MTQPSNAQGPRRRRLFLWILSGLPVVLVLAAVALPKALSTRPGRHWLLGRANRALAPGRLDLGTLEFSWFGPTRMTGFVLRNARGGPVVDSPRATWDRTFGQVLIGGPKLGVLRLDGAALDVERGPDGKIDLYETLRPVIRGDPRTSARFEVLGGRLRVRGRGLAEPLAAGHAGITLEIAPEPGPVSWKVRLSNGDHRDPENTLAVDGRLDRKGFSGDLVIQATGKDWPFALEGARGAGSGRLDGTLSAARNQGKWAFKGDAALGRVEASGPGTGGRRFGIDRVRGVWDVEADDQGYLVRALQVTAPRTTFSAAGRISTGGDVRLDGEADLTRLASSSDLGPDGLRLRWSALGAVRADDGGLRVDTGLNVTRLDADRSEGERIKVRVRASTPEGGGRIDLADLSVETRFGKVTAAGRIDDPGGQRLAELTGTVAPDWGFINTWVARNVEPGARISGRDRDFRLRAALGGDARNTLDGELGIGVDGADVYGMKLGPVAVVLRARGGAFTLDPIDTTVNRGRLHLNPEIRAADGSKSAAVVLGPGTELDDAEVNDEVSRRVLSFVAPVLDNATRVRGKVSATIDRAVFPIGEGAGGGGPAVEGAVVFKDVEFVPGPLLDGLFSVIGREDRPGLKLNEPVSLTIADRRVYQRGLVVPIGNLSKIELEGWVGFDRSLNLTASVPVLPTMLADRPFLGAVAADARVRVPIRGTLRKPEIDREAFRLGLRDLGRTLLGNGALQGAAGLLQRLSRPRDPDAPPPPTAEERRAIRQERRAERQLRRGRVPD